MNNQSSNNRYQIQDQLWNRLDQHEQQTFNRVYERMQQRQNEIIQSLSPECRTDVQQYFGEIASTVAVNFLAELHQTTA